MAMEMKWRSPLPRRSDVLSLPLSPWRQLGSIIVCVEGNSRKSAGVGGRTLLNRTWKQNCVADSNVSKSFPLWAAGVL